MRMVSSISVSILVALLFGFAAMASNPEESSSLADKTELGPGANSTCTLEMEVTGAVGSATLDYLSRAIVRATDSNCSGILMLINTPGGSLQTTRLMVKEILNSPIPFLCLVGPAGGHAGSAGAILLSACHVNGAIEGTNIGAATPVLSMGQEMPEDLRKKLLNDTSSWMDSITELRGRSAKFGRDIIIDAKAVSASEALKLGAIDTVVTRIEDFLAFAKGRTVKLSESKTVVVEVGDRIEFKHDLRFKLLDLLADPELSYLLLMASLALLYFEITHPGTLVAGTFGSIGLVISMIALHKLNVEWGGLALMLVGVALLIAEAFVPSFGILGIGGIAAFIIGSLFLFDPASGYQLPLKLILPTAVLIGAAMLGVGFLVLKSRRVRSSAGYDALVGEVGVVVDLIEDSHQRGQIEVAGEIWRFEANDQLSLKEKVKVVGHDGMTLRVRAIDTNEHKEESHV